MKYRVFDVDNKAEYSKPKSLKRSITSGRKSKILTI
jgi:hypothetical protein